LFIARNAKLNHLPSQLSIDHLTEKSLQTFARIASALGGFHNCSARDMAAKLHGSKTHRIGVE
jgi:hypothetical protein